MKCIPVSTRAEGSVTPMLEEHLTQVVLNNDRYSNYCNHTHDISVQILDDWRDIPTYVRRFCALRYDAQDCI